MYIQIHVLQTAQRKVKLSFYLFIYLFIWLQTDFFHYQTCASLTILFILFIFSLLFLFIYSFYLHFIYLYIFIVSDKCNILTDSQALDV